MAKKKIQPHEMINSAKILVEQHLNGHLTPNELQTKLNREGMNYTKLYRKVNMIFVIRGKGIERTELIF